MRRALDSTGARSAAALYAAVGIPQGVLVDSESGEAAGAVRRGGELVSLEPAEYVLWTMLMTPATREMASDLATQLGLDTVDEALERLEDQELLAAFDPDAGMDIRVASLRPLPLGFGLGNSAGDSAIFQIQNATMSLPSPARLDVISAMLWWDFDGTRSLRECATRLESSVATLSQDQSEKAVMQLTMGLMTVKLLYLDSTSQRERG